MKQKKLPSIDSTGECLKGVLLFLFTISLLLPTILLGNFLQLLTVFLLPFSYHCFRTVNIFIVGVWWRFANLVIAQLPTKLVIEGDPPPRDEESCIVFANHQEMPDIPILLAYLKTWRNIGTTRWFVKKALKWIPGIGWGMQLNGCIFLARDWTRDAACIRSTFASISRSNQPFKVVLFPEGTRITQKKWERSVLYAQKLNVPMTDMLLIPRPKGFVTTVLTLRDRLENIYDATIYYPEGICTLFDLFMGRGRVIKINVEKIPVSTLPKEKEALERWLIDRFQLKDKFLREALAE